MRFLNLISLAVMAIAALFTWNAVAAPVAKVHILENLSASESKEIHQALSKMGYQASKKSLFAESHDAIIITKALPTETEAASLTVEMVHLENDHSIPQSYFKYKVEGTDVQAVLSAMPRPEALVKDSMLVPVAYQQAE